MRGLADVGVVRHVGATAADAVVVGNFNPLDCGRALESGRDYSSPLTILIDARLRAFRNS